MIYFLVILLSLLTSLYLIFRNPELQTLTARILAKYLSGEVKTEIRIGLFTLSFTDGLLLKNILVLDRQNQVLFAAGKLSVVPGKFSLSKKDLKIKKLLVDHGIFQLITPKGDSVPNLNFLLDYFSSGDTVTIPDTTPSKPWKILVSSIELRDTRLHIQDENSPPAVEGIDFTNLDINHINLLIRDFYPDGDTLNLKIRHLTAIERSGFAVRGFSGEFQVGPKFLKARQLKIITDHSDLKLDFDFLYDEWDAFSDFLNKINIRADIATSFFDLQDVGYFAPELLTMKNRFRINGEIKGTVSNFKARNFKVAFGTTTRFWGNISANGLPNVEETFVDMKIRSLYTNTADIESLNLPDHTENIVLPELLKNGGTYHLKGNFTGFYNDFVANAKLQTDIGELSTDLSLRKKAGVRELNYDGEANVTNLNLDKLLSSGGMLGKITCKADIKGYGFDLNTSHLTMNVHVDSVEINNYIYNQISINGSLIEKTFSGKMNVHDRHLDLDFNGLVDMNDTLPVFNFTSDIRKADLFNLHLLKRDSVIELTSKLNVDFTGNSIDNIEGIISIEKTKYREGDNVVNMDRLSLKTSKNKENEKSFHLTSDLLDADFNGAFTFRELIPSLDVFISNYLASFNRMDKLIRTNLTTDQYVNFNIRLKKTDELASVFFPFLRLSPDSRFEGYYDEAKEEIFLDGRSQELSLFGTHLSNWYLKATSRKDNLNILSGCDELILKKPDEEDSLDIRINTFQLKSDIRQDTVHYNFTWVDKVSPSEVGGFASFSESPAIEFKLNTFNVRLDKRYWNIAGNNRIVFDTSSVIVDNFNIYSGNQGLTAQGKISKNREDTLSVTFTNLDISNLDHFLNDPNLNLDGILTGSVKLNNLYSSPVLLSNLKIKALKFNNESLGDAAFDLGYNAQAKRFDAKAEIIYTGNVGVNTPLLLTGSCYMAHTPPRLDFSLKLKSLNMKMIAPFVSGFMSGINGFASGDVRITGHLNKPVMKGKLNLARTEFKINYLNVPYSLADVVTVDSNAFRLDKVTIYDSLGNKAYVSGAILHNNFSDLAIDLNVEMNDFSAFHNSFAQNNVFYGTARGSGNIRIHGPLDDIQVDVRAGNGGGTHVIIPISLTEDISENDFIVFESLLDDTLTQRNKPGREVSKGFALNLALQVNPSADLEVFFPDELGNIRASGQGDIKMTMSPTSSFSMIGAYTIQKGTFLFKFKNLMRLNFAIGDGSKISWSGDPADAAIALNAIYKTRVSLGGLTTDQEKKNQRIPVECVIHLQGKLANPQFSFSLNLPNVEEEVRSFVYGAIDTTNAAIMNDQMFNILVMNQFSSPQGANTSSLDVGYTSVSILTNAFNSMLSQMTKNVAINVNYQRSGASQGQEIDMGFSTQLFDDRLIIDGLFGVNSMNPNSAANNASTIVGDINIQYVLTKNRRWRAKMFNRTNVTTDLENNSLYTQGIGISYQRDFAKWGDLFRKEKKQKESGK